MSWANVDPYIYQYVIGGIVFAVGLLYAFRTGAIGFSGKGLVWLTVLLTGFAFFAGLQGWLQYGSMTEAIPDTLPQHPDFSQEQGQRLGTWLDYTVMAAYFIAIVLVGVLFGRKGGGTKDFFFGGQRFSWWLISFSLVATVVGANSFVKYSKIAYGYGLASTQTYLNDWFWMPLLAFGWLPILYFGRLTSIPEYFEKRFGPLARRVVTLLLLTYLVGYIGINLYTMGIALNAMLGWNVLLSACGVAVLSATYVTVGGQTSVIMTDLFQGCMLLATGLVLLLLGADHLGGFDLLWEHLPRDHRRAFPHFNADPAYPGVGIFWQDAIANSAMFYFLNQGILMRFMAARSANEGRKAAVGVLVLLMPVAAIVVASGGWVGAAFSHAGVFPQDLEGDKVFFIAAEVLAMPGVFGLVLAALTAALMSTVDTLVTAVAAIVVNDIYDPLRPKATESQRMLAARISSVSVTLIGVLLVIPFSTFDSIYAAHGAFTAAITPPMVVALLLGVFWRRFTPAAAVATLVGGTFLICLSIFFPSLVAPFAHGVPATEVGDGLLDGMKQYKYMRALYGLVVSAVIGVSVTFFTKSRPLDDVRGWVWGTAGDAIAAYTGKGREESASIWAKAAPTLSDDAGEYGPGKLPGAVLSASLAKQIQATVGDMVFVTDSRWWLGGLRATHAVVTEVTDESSAMIALAEPVWETVVEGRESAAVSVQRLY
ncbi:MAG: SSS family solute:Na+ symporter [Myxococcota bacterium]|jgi:SSS family solute:Na+ symporter